MMRGFARISAAVPMCGVASFAANLTNILELWRRADQQGSALVVFPELALSGYTARDLFLDRHLLDKCVDSLSELVEKGGRFNPMALVGLPLRVGSRLYNVAAALQGGRVLGVVPKSFLPNYREFEEARWFRPGVEVPAGTTIGLLGESVPFGTDILFQCASLPDLVVGVEICEDHCVQIPPNARQVSAGATVICNLSASNFTIGKAELRRLLACSSSDRGKCAYVFVAAGPGESSTDLSFDADAFICENGSELVRSKRFLRGNQLVSADVDLELLIRERLIANSFGDCARENTRQFRRVGFVAEPLAQQNGLLRSVSPHPFLPNDPQKLANRCWEVFEIQTNALITRLQATGLNTLILGVSGGLDSTQAALVCAAALDQMELPRQNLMCVTMPSLFTSSRTRQNAEKLAVALGADFRAISVSEGTQLVLRAIEHPAFEKGDNEKILIERLRSNPELGDVALENVQARFRTLLLLSLANQHNGLMVGTGDLSEKALGWSTFGGDQISNYDVNSGVPKTLIQFVIRWVANTCVDNWTVGDSTALREALFSVLDTPISPELLPADSRGKITQLTEETVGPYELHDFFLYHFVRHGARPGRVLDLARIAFVDRYDLEVLKKWFEVFLQRFFDNQFKRSCAPDGPKVGMVSLSPRG
ncbi:MAG: NAD(+) synthase, partial [Pseudomonadota bacterium]